MTTGGSASRPDPDRLLAVVRREERRGQRGRLRIFFGASAGVGKTYAMLEAARGARSRGVDVVVGYVEPHGRPDTERLLEGLEKLPTLPVRYTGVTRQEFDLEAALRRAAGITLVDELAHSNLVDGVPPPRHAKRWQDVEELLEAGLDVWTTVNVQHLESLNDVVAGITGVRQRETVPDRVFDEAHEVELIDLPPDDLLDRLRAGKIYLPEQAGKALERFFRKPNLVALRELALRRTADRVDAAARELAATERASRPALARDRFLIAVAPDAQAESLVRFGKRFADALDSEWTVVSVETPQLRKLSENDRNLRVDVLRLAESLGAETVTLDGPTVVDALIEYARLRRASRIVVGEPRREGRWRWWAPSTAASLVRRASGIDVSVIARRDGEPAARHRADRRTDEPRLASMPARWERYGQALLVTAGCTAVAAAMDPWLRETNLVMVFLLGAAFAGLRLGRGPATLAALANTLCFNFFFVPPRLTFAVTDSQYLVTFAVMLAVGLIIATLAASVRQQTRVAGARERRTTELYRMTRELAAAREPDDMRRVAIRHVADTFDARVAVLQDDGAGGLAVPPACGEPGELATPDVSIGQWVRDNGRAAGLGTDTLQGASATYLPLQGNGRTLGVLAVLPRNPRRLLLPEQRHLLDTFAAQIGVALERARLAAAAESARLAAETAALRNTLLASISHDLRTPLAVITGASSALADPQLDLPAPERSRLAASIADKAKDVSQLVGNVLDLMRFESGGVALRRDWQSLDDLVGAALRRASAALERHDVRIDLPENLPPVFVDAALVTQIFANLLENAGRHTPAGTQIAVSAAVEGETLRVVVEDSGPGLPPGDHDLLFDKFQRGRAESGVPGVGLGLAICRAIVEAHGGTIRALDRPGGGARFEFTLPATEEAP